MARTGIGKGNHPNSRKNIEKHKFKKGQSGNPKGRPPNVRYVSEALRDLLANGKEITREALADALAKNLAKRALESDSALSILLERTEGKVVQPIGGEGAGPIIFRVIHERVWDKTPRTTS